MHPVDDVYRPNFDRHNSSHSHSDSTNRWNKNRHIDYPSSCEDRDSTIQPEAHARHDLPYEVQGEFKTAIRNTRVHHPRHRAPRLRCAV